MNIVKNPAWSRPLSTNVRKLMKQAREFPDNPDVIKGRRRMTDRDYSYCAMQGEIFMAAVDLGYSMEDFAPMYMCSQLAGVMDHSFSRAGKMDEDGVAGMLKLPLLLKSPETIVAVALWLNHIVEGRALNESPTEAVTLSASKTSMALAEDTDAYEGLSFDALADAYEYAYWLGYIYRFECLLHEESSRMVYGAFSEAFMRETWNAMAALLRDVALRDYADRICRKLDELLVGKLWPTLRLPQAASLAMGTTA